MVTEAFDSTGKKKKKKKKKGKKKEFSRCFHELIDDEFLSNPNSFELLIWKKFLKIIKMNFWDWKVAWSWLQFLCLMSYQQSCVI